MSIQVGMYERRCRLSPGQRVVAYVAVLTAGALARLRPGRLRRVLGWIGAGARPAAYYQALAARETIVAVSAHCAGVRQCLRRSIATCLLCRLHGQWPMWCAGVRTGPFRAHAWVVAEGRPVGEAPGFGGYHLLMSVPTAPVPPGGSTE